MRLDGNVRAHGPHLVRFLGVPAPAQHVATSRQHPGQCQAVDNLQISRAELACAPAIRASTTTTAAATSTRLLAQRREARACQLRVIPRDGIHGPY